ncbi:SUMO-activating enzyme subunit 1 [Eurytemora carolleeae]|uniref:SUMO-activating enzyme subunit 1 n=1 Tax=Eurytemora carolleeae TaxID=1294199 RepID=UPI000C76B7BC|nr:SUMO-activating enzyme subunit 1 [Eurytemora carolleeae]|eukprot:XP_023319960.1 SUMO-activating enzyme subunit 1-like [Eurytemora affinis]
MVEQENIQISEQEAQLYDRQIRLWGLDAQKRLRSAKVCLIGMRGLGCEVAKNLVLSGINSLKMVDPANVTEEDATSQFLAPRDKIGSNRAEASLERVQQLNPMVEVTADKSPSTEKEAEFFKQFTIVIATCTPKDELVRINSICRAEKIKFYAGDVMGFYGFSFMDLVEHEYVEEEVTQNIQPSQSEGGDEPGQKKQKLEETITKSVKKAMTFVSLAEALKVDWSSELYAKRVKRMDPSFFLLQVLFEFQNVVGHPPCPATRDQDYAKLQEVRNSTLTKLSVPVDKVSDELLSLLFSELSPVCAIVGGVLSQEVIKAISNKDSPHNNFFFYNPVDSCGVVETIGY